MFHDPNTHQFPLASNRLSLLALFIGLLGILSQNASAQDAAFKTDKPYYRVGEVVRVEYNLPRLDSDASPPETSILAYDQHPFGGSVTLDPEGVGVVELPDMTLHEGPVFLFIWNSQLADNPSMWIWVYPDLDPLPGALSIDGGNQVQMGAEITVNVKRPDRNGKEPLDLIVEFIRPAYVMDGGAIDRELKFAARNIKTSGSTATIKAPKLPGQYEIRLKEANSKSILDCLLLEVVLPNADNVNLQIVDTGSDSYPGSLSFTATGLGPFVATIVDSNQRCRYFSQGNNSLGNNPLRNNSIQTPDTSGSFELVVRGVLGDDPLVLKVPFDVDVPPKAHNPQRDDPLPILTFVSTMPLEAGDTVTLRISALASKSEYLTKLLNKYGSLSIGCYEENRMSFDDASWSDSLTIVDGLQPGDTASFTLLRPGFYTFKIGERKGDGWTSEWYSEITPSVAYSFPVNSGTLKLSQDTYQIGDEVDFTLESPWPIGWLVTGFWIPYLTPDGEWKNTTAEKYPVRTLKLPFEGGTYDLRWYDDGRLLDSKKIHIPVNEWPDAFRVTGGERDAKWQTQKPFKVEINLPDHPLFTHPLSRVGYSIVKTGEMSPTGTWKAPEEGIHPLEAQSGTFRIRPYHKGSHEIRLYAGRNMQYLVARVPIDVQNSHGTIPLPGGDNSPQPTDLPANASDEGSTLTEGMNIADVHCAVFQPPKVGNSTTGSESRGHLAEKTNNPVAEEEDPEPIYPNYTLYSSPAIPRVELWGTGLPGPTTNDWSHLIPKDVIDEHHLNGRWIILAVHGENLFEREVENPEVTWAPADKHLHYKLLHKGTYSFDTVYGITSPEWNDFWRSLHKRDDPPFWNVPGLRLEQSDVYVVAVRLRASSWAGQYFFKIGDTRVEWTLPDSTNMAATHFVRPLGIGEIVPDWIGVTRVEPGPNGQNILYERVDALFKYDQFYVEIESVEEVLTTDRIAFDLYITGEDGQPTPIEFRSYPLTAERIGNNRRLFRSPLIRLNNDRTQPGSTLVNGRREYWVPLAIGDRLAARIIPHEAVRQDRLAITQLYATPAQVNAFWREAVTEAARIAEIDIPQPLERMSDGAIYDNILSKPWETVDSTPFVQIGGREIPLTVEHLASMLLIRQQFITSMEEALPRLQKMRDQLNADPSWSHAVWVLLKDDALTPGSPIGDSEVLDWDHRRQTLILGTSVPFHRAYDEQWLDQKFRGNIGYQAEWQHYAASLIFRRYVDAAEQAYDYARTMDITDPDAKDLLKLTCIGMRRMVSRINPNMLRLTEDQDMLAKTGIGFRWEYDRHARHSMGLLAALGDEFNVNEAHVDEVNAYTSIAVAVIGLILPETYVGQAIAAGLEAGSVLMTITREIPEFIGRETDVQFAIGAYLVVGEERYITADLRRKPGWQMALEIVGGGLDVVASVGNLRHARTAWVSLRSDREVAEAFAKGADEFIALESPVQKAALVRLAQVSELKNSGNSLTGLETTIYEGGNKTLIEIESMQDMWHFRSLKTESLTEIDIVVGRNGRAAVAVADGVAPPRGMEPIRVKKQGAAHIVDEDALRIPEDTPWHKFDVGERVGKGGYAQVYELWHADDARDALKVFAPGPDGIADVERALRAETILREAGIPQLKILDHGVHNGMAYLVQEFLPSPGIFNGKTGGMMSIEMQEALLELHVNLAKAKIGFSDGWWANVYFFRNADDGPLICGVLDQDRVWKFGEGLDTGVWGPGAKDVTIDIFRNPGVRRYKLRSMRETTYTPRANLLMSAGYCPWPDAEFLMMKMLEHRGWINYNTKTGKFVSGRMDIELVKTYFPLLDHPSSINPRLDIPDHLMHLVPPPPPRIIPDDGQTFHIIPWIENMEYMPTVDRTRIAA